MADVVGDVLALGRRSGCGAVAAVVSGVVSGVVVVVVSDAAVVIRRVASWRCHERTMVMVLEGFNTLGGRTLEEVDDREIKG